MIQLSRALILGVVLLSTATAHARHNDWDADPVNPVYGSVNQCGSRRGGINNVYTNNAFYRGNQNTVSFPVNAAGGGAYYDARQGGRFVNGYQVNVGYTPGQINAVNGYNPYGSCNQVNPQIVQYQNGGGYVNGGYVNNNAYIGVNPWNGYTGNTYNGYTYTPQPAVGSFNNQGRCGNNNGLLNGGFQRQGIGNGGYGNRWQFRR